MPKRVFWPAAFVVMGLIFIAALMGYLPTQFLMFWPIILIIVGLGGLLTADREDWFMLKSVNRPVRVATKKSTSTVVSKKARRK